MSFFSFFKVSKPSEKVTGEFLKQKYYKSLRFQTFLAGTLGYSLYYVCRTGLNVVKGPIIEEGFLTATQLGAISSCLLYAYAAGKFVNGILADYDVDGTYWGLTKDGEYVMSGADTTYIADGEHYELTKTK